MSDDVLGWLQSWYAAQCDGDWEHQYGIKIDTVDNPGWAVEIDLPNGPLKRQIAGVHKSAINEENWLTYEFKDLKFVGFAGPRNLVQLLQAFRAAMTNDEGQRNPSS